MSGRRELIKKSTKVDAGRAWDEVRKLAHNLERTSPGAGELFMRRVTATLVEVHDVELRRLRGLRTSHDEPRSA